jgi:hypothetical protein
MIEPLMLLYFIIAVSNSQYIYTVSTWYSNNILKRKALKSRLKLLFKSSFCKGVMISFSFFRVFFYWLHNRKSIIFISKFCNGFKFNFIIRQLNQSFPFLTVWKESVKIKHPNGYIMGEPSII